MKLIHQDFKHGEVKFEITSPEDLWFLTYVIEPGDIIKGKTLRKIKPTEEAEGKKKPVFMALDIDRFDYSESSLRVTGKVLEGPEDVPHGSFHSFVLEQNSIAALIKKNWLSYQKAKLLEACEQEPPKILICVFDREESLFALLKRKGYEILTKLSGEVVKKRMPEKPKKSFYEEIIKQLESYDNKFKLDKIILASPSFWKEELLAFLKNDLIKKKIIQATCSGTDENALKEVLKRDELKEALKQDRMSQELKLVEELLSEISKESKAVYGKKDVKQMAEQGAVETLLVTDTLIKKFRAENKFSELDQIMKSGDKNNGKVQLISGYHEGGKKLDGLGGIGAILRYKLY